MINSNRNRKHFERFFNTLICNVFNVVKVTHHLMLVENKERRGKQRDKVVYAWPKDLRF